MSFRFTNDKTVRRLRWLMVGAMLFDKLNTVVGQPSTYWQQPETVSEGDPFFRFFLAHPQAVNVGAGSAGQSAPPFLERTDWPFGFHGGGGGPELNYGFRFAIRRSRIQYSGL